MGDSPGATDATASGIQQSLCWRQPEFQPHLERYPLYDDTRWGNLAMGSTNTMYHNLASRKISYGRVGAFIFVTNFAASPGAPYGQRHGGPDSSAIPPLWRIREFPRSENFSRAKPIQTPGDAIHERGVGEAEYSFSSGPIYILGLVRAFCIYGCWLYRQTTAQCGKPAMTPP